MGLGGKKSSNEIGRGGARSWFRADQNGAIRDFWAIFEANHAVILAEVTRAAHRPYTHAGRIAATSEAELAAQSSRLRESLRHAMEGNWQVFEAMLREEGSSCAERGLSFGAFSEAVGAFSRVCTPLLVKAYAKQPKRLAAAAAIMNELLERRMTLLAEQFLTAGEPREKATARPAPRQRQKPSAAVPIEASTKADEMFRGLLEAGPDAVVIADKAGRIVIVNARTEKLFGYGRADLVGQWIEMLAPERFRERHAGHRDGFFTDRDETKRGPERELCCLRKDGSEFPIEISVSPIETTEGLLMSSAIRDVTERKLLDETRLRLSAIVDSSEDAIIGMSLDGRITSWNRGATQIFGYVESEALGADITLIMPAGREDEETFIREQLKRGERVKHFESVRRRKDGRDIAVSLTMSPICSSTGTIIGFSKVARDTTEQKTVEAKFRGLLESSPDAVVIAGSDGRIEILNSRTERLFGYDRMELIGQPIELLVPERLRGKDTDPVTGYFSTLAPRTLRTDLDLFARRKDGSEFPADISLNVIETPHGPLGSAAIRDASDRERELEQQNRRIHESNRLKSEFLANMSHELRTPLNAIIGFASLMHSGKVGEMAGNHHEYIGDILTSSRHLLQLINDVLDLAKIESGKMELKVDRVDLAEVVHEVRTILRGLAAEKKVHVSVAIDPGCSTVTLDSRMLKQVLYNYLSNAIKFTHEGGKVSVRVAPEGNAFFEIEVEDTGIGIKPEDLDRLFVDFQQLDAGSAKRYAGTGLGLSLTKRIVEAQGGRVAVRSVLGQGSVFSVVLPREVQIPLPTKPDPTVQRRGLV